MVVEYRGEDFIYLVEVEDDDGKKDRRFFNQTDGSSSIESDDIELETKDKTGEDYGSITETVSIEGVLTKDDPAIEYIKESIRKKRLVRITRVNTDDLETEEGRYKIDNFEETSSVGEFVEYSIEATLNGDVKKGELDEVPEGAPESDNDDDDENESDSGD